MQVVPADTIETIVGTRRKAQQHIARASSEDQQVYILHSALCVKRREITECAYTQALEKGINEDVWEDHQDQPVEAVIVNGRLVPAEWIAQN